MGRQQNPAYGGKCLKQYGFNLSNPFQINNQKMHISQILRTPLITEKGTLLKEQRKYLFEVAPGANKKQVQDAVEKNFKVKVLAVNIIIVPGKQKRRGRKILITSEWKKAIVTIAPGQKIEFFEGV